MRSLETKRSRPRRDLRHSRPRLEKTGLETRLETETKSRDSITGLHNRTSQRLKNNVRYHCVEQRLICKIHAYDSISERDPCHIKITPQHNSLKTRVTPKLATAFRYLQNTNTAHSYITKLFVRYQPQQCCDGHNHTRLLKKFGGDHSLLFAFRWRHIMFTQP